MIWMGKGLTLMGDRTYALGARLYDAGLMRALEKTL